MLLSMFRSIDDRPRQTQGSGRRPASADFSGRYLVERPNHLKVKLRTDPHGVGVDHFLAGVRTAVASAIRGDGVLILHICGIRNLRDQGLRLVKAQEVCRVVAFFSSGCLVQIVERKSPFGVLVRNMPRFRPGFFFLAFILKPE